MVLLVVGLMVGKSLVTAALCHGFGVSFSTSVRIGLLFSQGGEFGFILFIAVGALGLLAAETEQLLLASVALTMAATPFMAYAGAKFTAILLKRKEVSLSGMEEMGEGLEDHVLIAGYGRVGQTVTKLLSTGGISYVALDLDVSRITACRIKGMPVYFGDASQIDILKSAGASRARGAVVTTDQPELADRIVSALREVSPTLPIFVRACDLDHVRRLELAGATQAVPEALEASLQLGAVAMTSLGVRTDEVAGIREEFRSDDYASLGDTVYGVSDR